MPTKNSPVLYIEVETIIPLFSRVKTLDLIRKAKRLRFKNRPNQQKSAFSWTEVYEACRSRIPGDILRYEHTLKNIRVIEWT